MSHQPKIIQNFTFNEYTSEMHPDLCSSNRCGNRVYSTSHIQIVSSHPDTGQIMVKEQSPPKQEPFASFGTDFDQRNPSTVSSHLNLKARSNLEPIPKISFNTKRIVSDYEGSSETMFKPGITRDQLNPHDVLCGRGSGSNDYRGNIAYRKLICAKKDAYRQAKRRDKSILASEIVEKVHSMGGRFLERSGEGDSFSSVGSRSSYSSEITVEKDMWYEVGKTRAEVKTKQALRQHYVGEEILGAKKTEQQENLTGSSDYLQDDSFLFNIFPESSSSDSTFDFKALDIEPNVVISSDVQNTHRNVPTIGKKIYYTSEGSGRANQTKDGSVKGFSAQNKKTRYT